MKRVSSNARVTGLAWVAALSLSLALAQCVAPAAGAEEPDPAVPAAAAADPLLPDPPGEAPSDPPGEESGPQQETTPAADPEDAEPATPPETDPVEPVPNAPEPPSLTGPADPSPLLPEPEDPAPAETEVPGGPDAITMGTGMMPLGIALDDVCAIGGDGYPTLDAAISVAASGQKITLLRSITHTSPVVIIDKDLIFDLSEGSISIDTSALPGSAALTLRNSAITITGGGYIDARGGVTGVHANNASITVRYAIALYGTGAYAEGGGKITVRGDAKGYAVGALAYGAGSAVAVDDDAMADGAAGRGAEALASGQVTAKNAIAGGAGGIGAAASSNATVVIAQQAIGTAVGARATGGGRITVGGKVSATVAGGVAAWADLGGSITADGDLVGTVYLRVGNVDKQEHESEPLTTLAGYRTYRDGTSIVWVKGVPLVVNVCAIGDREFATLDDALAEVDRTSTTPTVIRLLTSIDYAKTLDLASKRVVFDLSGFDLKLSGGTQPGLQVTGGSVGYSGAGAFVVTGAGNVVEVTDGGTATVTGIRIVGSHSIGAFAGGEDSRIVVNGDIRTTGSQDNAIGADAAGRGLVIVNGTIWIEGGNTFGAVALDGGRVSVHVDSGGAITVSGDNGVGANPRYGGEVVVSGDVSATGADAKGVVAFGGAARITGDVTATGRWSFGVYSADQGDVLVSGKVIVTGTESTGIDAHVGEGTGGLVRVTGSVTVTGGDALGVVAYSRERSQVTSLVIIDGQLEAPSYLLVDGIPRTMDSKDGTEPSGHWLYLGPYGSLVKIRNGQPVVTPEPSDPPVTPDPSDPPVTPGPSDPPETPGPSESPDLTPEVSSDPEPSESASAPSDSDELPATGAAERQWGWLLGLMVAMVLGGVTILVLNGRTPRGGGWRGSHQA